VTEFKLTFKGSPLGFTVEPPEHGQAGTQVTSVNHDLFGKQVKNGRKAQKQLKRKSEIIKINGEEVSTKKHADIVGILKQLMVKDNFPIDITFRAPRQVKANADEPEQPKGKQRGGRQQGGRDNGKKSNKKRKKENRQQNGEEKGNNKRKAGQNMNPPRPHEQNEGPDAQVVYQEGERVKGQGSGPYRGKWFPGTITSVRFDQQRGQYQYQIEYDQTPGKEYKIRPQHLKRLDPEIEAKDRESKLLYMFCGEHVGDVTAEDIKKLETDEDGLYGLTHAAIANMQSNILASFAPSLPQEVSITDGTAGLGGNTHSFAKFFKNVHAIEIDEKRANQLRNNMKALKCDSRVEVLAGNFIDNIAKYKEDTIVFLDVPWGGPDYREKPCLELYLDDSEGKQIHVAQLCNMIREQNPNVYLIGLKLPYNYNQEAFLQQTQNVCNIAEFQFSYTRIQDRTDISQILLLLDYHHNAKEFSFRFHSVQQKNKYVQAEVLRRKAFVDNGEVMKYMDKVKSILKPSANEFVPSNKRHALAKDPFERMD